MAAVRIDLHVHSNASDGTDDPAEVVRRARAAGLDVMALTDHDTQAGIAAARDAAGTGLTLVPGMELSCQFDGRSAHLLGYLFDPDNPELGAETAQIRDDRTYRAKAMVAKARELGADVTWEQVTRIAGDAVVGRPHIARALAAAGAVETTPPTRSRPTGSPTTGVPSSAATRSTSPAVSPWSGRPAASRSSPTRARPGTRYRTRSSRGSPTRGCAASRCSTPTTTRRNGPG